MELVPVAGADFRGMLPTLSPKGNGDISESLK